LLNIAENVDVLFISGDHDSMCDLKMLDEVRGKMKAATWFVKVIGADHGMNVRGGKKLKDGTEMVGKMTGMVAAEWLRQRDKEEREMELSWDGEESMVVRSKWKAGERMKQGAKSEERNQTHEGGAESGTEQATAEAGKRKRRKFKK
jgi:heme-degrading monooxygenase HmoA